MAMETHRPCARGEKKKLRSLPESLANGKHATTRVHRKPPQRILKSLKTASTREKPENYARMRPVSSPDLRAHYIFFLDQKRPKCGKKFPTGNRANTSKREERVRAKTARYQSSIRTERGKREREKRCESICSSRTIFVYLRFVSFCFLSRVKSVKKFEERERDEKSKKNLGCLGFFVCLRK